MCYIHGVDKMSNKALELFTAVPRCYNCAQAVAAGCSREDLVAVLQSSGGGRAPENCCGALYAAMLIAGEKDTEAIRKEFVEKLGSDRCAVLKGELAVPCPRCVEVAADILEKYGK